MRKGLIILGDLSDDDVIWMARTGKARALAVGETLIAQGDHPQALYIVIEGWFDISAQGSPVARATVGDVLGEMAFVEKQAASSTITAAEPSHVLAIPRGALLAQLDEDRGFAARFYRALAVFLSDRLRGMMEGEVGQEIDEGLLDNLHAAGDRMLRLIALLEGKEG